MTIAVDMGRKATKTNKQTKSLNTWYCWLGYTLLLKKIQLVVSRLFAGDNRLSPDILLVTTGCQQTFCWWQPVVSRPKSLVTTGCQQTPPLIYIHVNCKCILNASRNTSSNNINIYWDNLSVVVFEMNKSGAVKLFNSI